MAILDFRAAANDLLDRWRWARSIGLTFAGKRDTWGVLGYDDVVSVDQYRQRYARGGIARQVVDALPNAVWRGSGTLVEDDDPETETQFEAAWDALNDRHGMWSKLQRLHTLASLGSFSVLLIGAPGDISSPLPRGAKQEDILYLTPFGGGVVNTAQTRGLSSTTVGADATVKEWVTDAKNPRFGLPLTYQLKRTAAGTPSFGRDVHWTRVIHVPAFGFVDDAIYGPPALEPVWNYLQDLDKVVGGGAEAFWLRANAGIQFDVDKKMALPSDQKDVDKMKEELREQAEAYEHQLSRMIRTRGVNINQLGSDVADFKGPQDAILTLIAGTSGIPKRILTGSEMGQLASEQDRDNWNDRVKDCRTSYAYPIILRPLIDRLIEFNYLPTPEVWNVSWPDVMSMSENEKLTAATKAIQLNGYGERVITGAEIREIYFGRAPLDEGEDFTFGNVKDADHLSVNEKRMLTGQDEYVGDPETDDRADVPIELLVRETASVADQTVPENLGAAQIDPATGLPIELPPTPAPKQLPPARDAALRKLHKKFEKIVAEGGEVTLSVQLPKKKPTDA